MGPGTFVTPPRAFVPRIGLIAQANVVQETDERWANGMHFLPENCTGAGNADVCSTDVTTVHAGPSVVDYQPFEIWAGDKCSPFDWKTHDYQARALRLLAGSASKQLESEFWTGTLAKANSWPNAYLASSSAVLVGTGALKPENALACLEQGLADCGQGQRGMIHAPKTIVTHWDAQHLLRREGNQILTINDTIVVSGAGYDGSSPSGHAAANQSVWAYATSGIVDVRLGKPTLLPDPNRFDQALERSQNTIEWRAYQAAAAVWDNCCHLAVEVEVAICPPGGS